MDQLGGVIGGCRGIGIVTEKCGGGRLFQGRLYPWAAEGTCDPVDSVPVDQSKQKSLELSSTCLSPRQTKDYSLGYLKS